MAKIPKSTGRELAPEGLHNAVCIGVTDLGTQPSAQWGDKRKCMLAFELGDEQASDGKAFVVYKQYTFSDSPKSTLMKDLSSWLNVKNAETFDMDSCLRAGCQLKVEHSETEKGTYANISSILPLPKGVKVKPTEPVRSFYLDETFDIEVFNSLAGFLQDKIADSPEYAHYKSIEVSARARERKKASTEKATPAKKAKK